MNEKVKCLIIGSGPAGYTAAIYASRANLAPVLYEGMQSGGQLTQTTEIENFPGYPEGIDANLMMADLRAQAERFGTDVRFGCITEVDFSCSPKKLTIDGEKVIEADTVIIATGASAKYLGLADEHKYMGKGVSAAGRRGRSGVFRIPGRLGFSAGNHRRLYFRFYVNLFGLLADHRR